MGLFLTLLLALAAPAAAVVPAAPTQRAEAVASVRILARAVRVGAQQGPSVPDAREPVEPQVEERPCDAGAPAGCRMLVIDLP